MTHEERVWHHEMETLEGIHEHAERIASLEELAQGFYKVANYVCDHWDNCEYCEHGRYAENMREKCTLGKLNDQMAELGIEVPS